jgi:hypothetical protein
MRRYRDGWRWSDRAFEPLGKCGGDVFRAIRETLIGPTRFVFRRSTPAGGGSEVAWEPPATPVSESAAYALPDLGQVKVSSLQLLGH